MVLDEQWVETPIIAFCLGMTDYYETVTMLMILITRAPPTEYKYLSRLDINKEIWQRMLRNVPFSERTPFMTTASPTYTR